MWFGLQSSTPQVSVLRAGFSALVAFYPYPEVKFLLKNSIKITQNMPDVARELPLNAITYDIGTLIVNNNSGFTFTHCHHMATTYIGHRPTIKL